MTNQISEPEELSETSSEESGDMYSRIASQYSRRAIFIWCITGLTYAAATWHVLWLPGILIFIPGIFCASLIAAAFFIPIWLIMKTVNQKLAAGHRNHASLLVMLAGLLRLGGFSASIVGPVGYVKMLRHFMN